MMDFESVLGLKRIYNAILFSFAGFKAAWQHEQAFRQELVALVLATPVVALLAETPVEQVLLLGCIVLVIIVEILNSAIEAIVDRIGLEKHELSGRAKDLGSAAVMLTIALAVMTWLIILI